MPSQIRKRPDGFEQDDRTGRPEPVAIASGIPIVLPSRDGPVRRGVLPDHRLIELEIAAVTTLTTQPEPEEVLIADARANLTPAQMVDRKLMALFPSAGLGVSLQRNGRPVHLRGHGNPASSNLPSSLAAARNETT